MLKPNGESVPQGRLSFNISRKTPFPIENTIHPDIIEEDEIQMMSQVLDIANAPLDLSLKSVTQQFNVLFPEQIKYQKVSTMRIYGIRDLLVQEYLEKIQSDWDDFTTNQKEKIVSAFNSSVGTTHKHRSNVLIKLNNLLFNKKGSMSDTENKIKNMLEELEPSLYEEYNAKQAGGQKGELSRFFDEKIVMPYLLGGFVNGKVDTLQKVSQLKDETSRRELFESMIQDE